ncbi:unnamed protein product [Paramecium sonneborni]|uniref:Uncharacterized protein n=1 Tax=Paramecium sonneborni TaxID=65129 RepID=A0A8S1NIQ0_9CILI|nr:unnamed protein product [Paramecium sonneborni]
MPRKTTMNFRQQKNYYLLIQKMKTKMLIQRMQNLIIRIKSMRAIQRTLKKKRILKTQTNQKKEIDKIILIVGFSFINTF